MKKWDDENGDDDDDLHDDEGEGDARRELADVS